MADMLNKKMFIDSVIDQLSPAHGGQAHWLAEELEEYKKEPSLAEFLDILNVGKLERPESVLTLAVVKHALRAVFGKAIEHQLFDDLLSLIAPETSREIHRLQSRVFKTLERNNHDS